MANKGRSEQGLFGTVVKWFGKTEWFRKIWHGVPDNPVQHLNASGVENTTYDDREW